MIHEELQRLEQLAGQIAQKLQRVEQENAYLQEEMERMQRKLDHREGELENFKNQIKISKIVKNIPFEYVESTELKGRIENYIKEIDRIIAHLSE